MSAILTGLMFRRAEQTFHVYLSCKVSFAVKMHSVGLFIQITSFFTVSFTYRFVSIFGAVEGSLHFQSLLNFVPEVKLKPAAHLVYLRFNVIVFK